MNNINNLKLYLKKQFTFKNRIYIFSLTLIEALMFDKITILIGQTECGDNSVGTGQELIR